MMEGWVHRGDIYLEGENYLKVISDHSNVIVREHVSKTSQLSEQKYLVVHVQLYFKRECISWQKRCLWFHIGVKQN